MEETEEEKENLYHARKPEEAIFFADVLNNILLIIELDNDQTPSKD